MAQPEICFNRVESMILKLVCAQLFHQPDAAPFLLLVNQHASSFFGDGAQRQLKLIVTIAAQGVKDFACDALRMNANQGREAVNVAENKASAVSRSSSPVFC